MCPWPLDPGLEYKYWKVISPAAEIKMFQDHFSIFDNSVTDITCTQKNSA